MKRIAKLLGYAFIGVAIIASGILSLVRIGGLDEEFSSDLLGFAIPTPPAWIGMIPYVGRFFEFIFSLFSLHGLVIVGIWVVCLIISGIFLMLGEEKNNAK